jgi:hypothetical protein
MTIVMGETRRVETEGMALFGRLTLNKLMNLGNKAMIVLMTIVDEIEQAIPILVIMKSEIDEAVDIPVIMKKMIITVEGTHQVDVAVEVRRYYLMFSMSFNNLLSFKRRRQRSPDPPSNKLILTSLPSSVDRDSVHLIALFFLFM